MLIFGLYRDCLFVQISKDEQPGQIILFRDEDEFSKSIEKYKSIFIDKGINGYKINIDYLHNRNRDNIEYYSSEEFYSLIKREMDDLHFMCDICISYYGGYMEFFHCLKCIQSGDRFNVCHNCIENNDDACKDHENEFHDHKLIDPEIDDEIFNIFIKLVRES